MAYRFLLPALVLGGHVLLCGAASVGAESHEPPPLSPQGEAVMDDPDTASYCTQQAVELGAKLDKAPDSAGYFNWKLGEPLVTQNETWGVVCRIDFKMAGEDFASRVNRLVLYVGARKLNFMIAIGQDIAPLHADAAVVTQ